MPFGLLILAVAGCSTCFACSELSSLAVSSWSPSEEMSTDSSNEYFVRIYNIILGNQTALATAGGCSEPGKGQLKAVACLCKQTSYSGDSNIVVYQFKLNISGENINF